MRNMSAASEEVLLETKGGLGVISLNNPKQLNALNLNMVRLIQPRLAAWGLDESVGAVLIKGTGEKAFCAGGDVVSIAKSVKTPGGTLHKEFFREEYILNYTTGVYEKPYIALIDGVTMGGGVGLSVHGKFRVATEKTLFAMPETAIGLFPDVGGGYFLPRLPHKGMGIFLALTGHRLRSRDVWHAGVATHLISSAQLPVLEAELAKPGRDLTSRAVKNLLDELHHDSLASDGNPEFSLIDKLDLIGKIFGNAQTVEEVLDNCRADGSEWALQMSGILAKMSPRAMKITLRQILEGAGMSFSEIFRMEYRLSQRCMEDNDFVEGIRALLIEKDNSPRWSPDKVELVTDECVQHFFSPLPSNDLDVSSELTKIMSKL